MTAKAWAILAAAALLFGLGFSAGSCRGTRAAASGLAKANQIDQAATAAISSGVQHAQDAQAKEPEIKADLAAVDADRARLAAHKAALPVQPAPVPGSAPVAGTPAAPAAQAAVDTDKDQLITDQAKTITDLQAQNADLKASVQDLQKGAAGLKAENLQLRGVVTSLQAQKRPWGVGFDYGTNGTVGPVVVRQIGPVEVGVSVDRRSIGGGQTSLEAIAHAIFRF